MGDDEGEAYARNTDPSPSHDAAEDVDARAREEEVFNYLSSHHQWKTNFQIADDTGLQDSSVTPRMPRLLEKGMVERKIDFGFNRKGVYKQLLHHRVPIRKLPMGFDLGERIKQVRAVEEVIDKKQEELDAMLEQHHKFVETGRAEILAFLNQTNQKSANTEFGGCHWKPKITYRVEDKDAFRRHVIGAEAWELITWASAPSNCESFTEEHKMPPPGLVRNAVNILYITPPTKPKGKNKKVEV